MKRIVFALALCAVLAVQMAAAPVSDRVAPQAATIFDLLPDTTGVVSVNVAQLTTQLERIASAKPQLAAKLRDQIDQMATRGLDLSTVDQVIVGFSLESGKRGPELVIIASGRFNEADVLEHLNRESRGQWEARPYNNQRIYIEPANQKKTGAGKTSNASKTAIAFFDNGSRIAIGSAEAVRRVADTHAGLLPSAGKNQALMAAIGQAQGAAIQFAFVVPESMRERMRNNQGNAMFQPLSAVREVTGSVDFNDTGALANITLVNDTEQAAGDIVNIIHGGLTLLRMAAGRGPEAEIIGQVLDGVTVAQSVANVNITATVPAELIRQLIEGVQQGRVPGI